MKFRHALLINGALTFLTVATIVGVVYSYVSSEHTFYWSDYAGYQNITQEVLARYRRSLLTAIEAIARSTKAEYNAIFTIPLIPFLLVFGESRIVYEVALGVVYLLPFTLVLSAIALQVIPAHSRTIFWLSVAVVLLTPIAWVPTLRGYPDTGAAVLMCAGMWAYLRDPKLNSRWQIVFIGLAAASSMLFRRHFTYAVIALFGAMTLNAVAGFARQCGQKPRPSFHDLYTSIRRIGFTALIAVIALLVIGPFFLYRGLTTNYIALYESYTDPPLIVLKAYASAYGWGALAAAALGIVWGIRSGTTDTTVVTYLAIFTGLSVLEWSLVVRQMAEHYTLYFTPMVALGLVVLVGTILSQFKGVTRVLAVSGFFLCMGMNMVVGLSRVDLLSESPIRSLFADKRSPLSRSDHAEMVRLVSYLRSVAAHSDAIYVAASSSVLNTSLLHTGERALYGWDSARLNFLTSPQIDSRDAWPLEMLLQAQYVVVGHPVQHHLRLEKQLVVKAVYDLFTDHQLIAQDFALLPATFALEEDTSVSVYRRARPTSLKTALETLRLMQNMLRSRPGGQLDWVMMTPAVTYSVKKNRDNAYWVTMHPSKNNAPLSTTLLYLGEMPEDVVITGTLAVRDRRCAGAILRLSKVSPRNEITDITDGLRLRDNDFGFAFTFSKQDAINVLLTVTNEQAPIKDCPLEIDNLKLARRSTAGFIDNQTSQGPSIRSESRNRGTAGL